LLEFVLCYVHRVKAATNNDSLDSLEYVKNHYHYVSLTHHIYCTNVEVFVNFSWTSIVRYSYGNLFWFGRLTFPGYLPFSRIFFLTHLLMQFTLWGIQLNPWTSRTYNLSFIWHHTTFINDFYQQRWIYQRLHQEQDSFIDPHDLHCSYCCVFCHQLTFALNIALRYWW